MNETCKSRRVYIIPLLKTVSVVILLFIMNQVWADSDYSITWYSIEDGGAAGSGGDYSITGLIGQYDSDVLQADRYVLSGGFGAGTAGCKVTLADMVMLAEQWLGSGAADIDRSGTVNMVDFNTFSEYWLDACPAGWPLIEL